MLAPRCRNELVRKRRRTSSSVRLRSTEYLMATSKERVVDIGTH